MLRLPNDGWQCSSCNMLHFQARYVLGSSTADVSPWVWKATKTSETIDFRTASKEGWDFFGVVSSIQVLSLANTDRIPSHMMCQNEAGISPEFICLVPLLLLYEAATSLRFNNPKFPLVQTVKTSRCSEVIVLCLQLSSFCMHDPHMMDLPRKFGFSRTSRAVSSVPFPTLIERRRAGSYPKDWWFP